MEDVWRRQSTARHIRWFGPPCSWRCSSRCWGSAATSSAGQHGFILFAGIGLVTNFLSYWFSDRIALASNRAKPISREAAPELYGIVERLSNEAGIPTPPIYIIP